LGCPAGGFPLAGLPGGYFIIAMRRGIGQTKGVRHSIQTGFGAGFLLAAVPALFAPHVTPAFQASNPIRFAGNDARMPQTALSLCPALTVATREELTAGSALAVSSDGQFQLIYFHTPRGARLTLLNRDTQESRQIDLPTPPIPPGVTWRIQDVQFSPDSRWLAVRSVSMIWVLDTANGRILFTTGMDAAKQLYPGTVSWAANKLLVTFWPPESYLADADSKVPVGLGIYELPGGEVSRTMPLSVHTSNEWLEARLSPDATRLAVLERARNLHSKARLALLAVDSGKALWARGIAVDDFAWSTDSKRLFVLGKELTALDVEKGKTLGGTAPQSDAGEYQRLRVNEAGQIAAGTFIADSSFTRPSPLAFWRLDTFQKFCEVPIEPASSVDAWLTARGEVLALEETYDVRPPLRLLKSARLVTYKLINAAETTKPAKE
jgi:hypothetical protein